MAIEDDHVVLHIPRFRYTNDDFHRFGDHLSAAWYRARPERYMLIAQCASADPACAKQIVELQREAFAAIREQ